MTLYTALTGSLKFAALLVLSSYLPVHETFSAKTVNENVKSLPIIMCHGNYDNVIPLSHAQMSLEYLKEIGFSNVNFHTYPMEHSSCEEEMKMIFEKIKAILA